MGICDCLRWAQTDFVHFAITGHHPDCPHSPSVANEAFGIIKELVTAMEAWAADEDGVHPDAWGIYCESKMMVCPGWMPPKEDSDDN